MASRTSLPAIDSMQEPPRATIVMLGLWGVAANLFMIPGHYDVALRDLGLSLGALALARLARCFGR